MEGKSFHYFEKYLLHLKFVVSTVLSGGVFCEPPSGPVAPLVSVLCVLLISCCWLRAVVVSRVELLLLSVPSAFAWFALSC